MLGRVHFEYFDYLLPNVLLPQAQAVVWLLVTIGAALLFRRFRGLPLLLILIGSIAYFVSNLYETFMIYALTNSWIANDSPFWRHWSLDLFQRISSFATICFPLGFVWGAFRAPQITNR
jgi:hypothetical protein